MRSEGSPKKRAPNLAASIVSALVGAFGGLFVLFALSPAANTQPVATMVFGGAGALVGMKLFPWAWRAFSEDGPPAGDPGSKTGE